MKNILILGAGFGGLTAANELAKDEQCRVVLIDRNAEYCMGLNKLKAMLGKEIPKECKKPYASLKAKGIEFVKAEIAGISLDRRMVEIQGSDGTAQGYSYDYLVIALGADVDSAMLKGLANAYNLYSMAGARELDKALHRLQKGKLALLVAKPPFKCPAAPYEAAFLMEEYLRKRGVRPQVEIAVYTAEPQPMPVAGKVVGERLQALLVEKGIAYFPNHKIKEIGRDSMTFENGVTAGYDLLAVVPPHTAPKILSQAKLCDESGWIPVDRSTLQTQFPDVYAIGDCAAIKLANGAFLPKAGILAEEEARVVAHNILTEIRQTGEKRAFQGKGYCYVEIGDGKAGYADADFFAEPVPQVTLQEPSEKYFQEKIEFEKKRLKEWF